MSIRLASVFVVFCLLARAAMAEDAMCCGLPWPGGSPNSVCTMICPGEYPNSELTWIESKDCTITLTDGKPGVATSECTCAEMWDAIGDHPDVTVWLHLYERACGPIKVTVKQDQPLPSK